MTASAARRAPDSWRDPSGFVYTRNEVLLRQVNIAGAREWDALVASGSHANSAMRVSWSASSRHCSTPPLATREDGFANYDEGGFRAAFEAHWAVEDRAALEATPWVVYRMRQR